MMIRDFDHECSVSSRDELVHILNRRRLIDGLAVNSYWTWHEDQAPLLSLVVRDGMACLWYTTDEQKPGFSSVGKVTALPDDGLTTFHLDGTEHVVSNQIVIPIDDALAVAMEFFGPADLPKGIAWNKL